MSYVQCPALPFSTDPDNFHVAPRVQQTNCTQPYFILESLTVFQNNFFQTNTINVTGKIIHHILTKHTYILNMSILQNLTNVKDLQIK